jgi:hypothetical protein
VNDIRPRDGRPDLFPNLWGYGSTEDFGRKMDCIALVSMRVAVRKRKSLVRPVAGGIRCQDVQSHASALRKVVAQFKDGNDRTAEVRCREERGYDVEYFCVVVAGRTNPR